MSVNWHQARLMELVELKPADAPKDAVPIVPTSLYPNPVKFLYAIPDAPPTTQSVKGQFPIQT